MYNMYIYSYQLTKNIVTHCEHKVITGKYLGS